MSPVIRVHLVAPIVRIGSMGRVIRVQRIRTLIVSRFLRHIFSLLPLPEAITIFSQERDKEIGQNLDLSGNFTKRGGCWNIGIAVFYSENGIPLSCY
jgi:hypothetical protein